MNGQNIVNQENNNSETVTSEVLAVWLGSKKSVLLIDCRGFLSHDKKKLKGALAMRCNSIKIKRCKGELTYELLSRTFNMKSRTFNMLKARDVVNSIEIKL